jgi:hypothetical protein
VLAWIVGQWSIVEGNVAEKGNGVLIQLDEKAWFFRRTRQQRRTYHFEIKPPRGIPDGDFIGSVKLIAETPVEIFIDATDWWQEAGVGYARVYMGSTRVSVRHWLVVTMFALFNGVLMWVYRKRSNTTILNEGTC